MPLARCWRVGKDAGRAWSCSTSPRRSASWCLPRRSRCTVRTWMMYGALALCRPCGRRGAHFVRYGYHPYAAHPRFDEKAAGAAPDTGACDRAARPVFFDPGRRRTRSATLAPRSLPRRRAASARDPTKGMNGAPAAGRTTTSSLDSAARSADVAGRGRRGDGVLALRAAPRVTCCTRRGCSRRCRLARLPPWSPVRVLRSNMIWWSGPAIRVAEADAARRRHRCELSRTATMRDAALGRQRADVPNGRRVVPCSKRRGYTMRLAASSWWPCRAADVLAEVDPRHHRRRQPSSRRASPRARPSAR